MTELVVILVFGVLVVAGADGVWQAAKLKERLKAITGVKNSGFIRVKDLHMGYKGLFSHEGNIRQFA